MSHPKFVSAFAGPEKWEPTLAPVCVTGLPGHGAAMVIERLQEHGLWLGKPETLSPVNRECPDDGFESRTIAEINEQVVNLFAERRASAEGRTAPWNELPGLGFLKARAKHALDAIASSAPGRLWGWRHPHSFDTLPFWCELVSPLKAVVCVQNARAGGPETRGELAAHGKAKPVRGAYETILRSKLPPWQILVSHYESWFIAPERELDRIASFLGMESLATPATSLRLTSVGGESHAEAFERTHRAQPWGKRKAA